METEKTKTPERLQDELRMHKSAELLRNPIEFGEIGYDRIFTVGNVAHDHPNMFRISVKSEYPTVVMKDSDRQELGLFDVPTVSEVREGDSEISLISGGTWLWIVDNDGNSHLPLLRRDSEASVDPDCLTGAAGRSGEPLSKTAIAETNQEFIFLQNEEGSEFKLLAFYREDDEKGEIVRQKIDQVKTNIDALQARYNTTGDEKYKQRIDSLMKLRGEEDLILLRVSDVENKGQELDTIYTEIDGEIIDTVRGIAYMDKAHNTLEVRVVLQVVLPPGIKISTVMDGESFLRDSMMVPKDRLAEIANNNQLVPALDNYITRLSVGTRVVDMMFGDK